ncbi:MAG: hypothetical protein WCV83_00950 [Candidatus Magasanikbacteria bacterium]|jgi:hypothetical protein
MNKEDVVSEGLKILSGWKTTNPSLIDNLINRFNKQIEYFTQNNKRWNITIEPYIVYVDNYQLLLETLISQIGREGIEKLIIYLLENDSRLHSKMIKPVYPPYLVQFAYLLLYILPKGFRTRRLFESFWDHQAKIFPGIDEQFARNFFNPFIEEDITNVKEIQKLLIRDWWRWQEASMDSLYYGVSIGLSAVYFVDFEQEDSKKINWELKEKELEIDWKEKTGKEPKKWF